MPVKTRSKPGIFYGWRIVSAAFIAWALYGGFYFYGFSAFFMSFVNEFGWSRAALSGVFSLSRLEGGILGPVSGFLVDKFGPRRMMILGIIIMGAGFILLSRIDSLLTFSLVFILCIALGGTIGIQQAPIVAITNWFIKKRGTAIGVGLSGMGLGGALVPVMAWLIVQYDWRTAVIILGIALWVMGIPLAFVMRHRPEQYGYLPDGETKEINARQNEPQVAEALQPPLMASTKERGSAQEINFTARQALKTKAFWLLALIFGLRQFVISAIVVHQIPFLTGIGISPEVAATVLGSIAMISVAGRLGFGRLADIFEKKYLMVITLGLITLGCFILANAQTLWHVIVFLVIYSPAYGGGSTLMQAIRAEYFGRQYFGSIMGFMDLAQIFGLTLGPVFAGLMYDATGSYRLAFITFAITAAVAMMLMLIARRPTNISIEATGSSQ